ncbi:MAG: SDR family NAD(P)-dependent oxidoreductase [Phenylobacterium sp.]|uniref:SDR family NAD(P)-dependent oxidoreductase n=1 Tax=Phenylobacterium sp. TaxID=1871053 RepID=UPI002732F792|nr:SDR family NAD(P)-dependent oxidoreductase [Phenylobacterium sp.]MDP3175755.1 SDR family NAD(P)-dependent oxidoreductase [Phenylobacterium sp.]
MDDFKGRVAVITGGASGIGLGVAQALAQEGAKLVIADIEQAALDDAVAGLRAQGAEAIGVITDVSDRAAMLELADRTWDHFGAAHLVMHNAGVGVGRPAFELTHDDWRWVIGVNLWGPVNGVEAFLPRMLAQGEPGQMLFTASFAGLVPFANNAPYNVTKAGVIALAETLRKDLRGKNVTASVLCPMHVVSKIGESQRNRPVALGGVADYRAAPDSDAPVDHRILPTEDAVRLILDGLRRGDLFIHTHQEAEGFVRKRVERIAQSFPYAL